MNDSFLTRAESLVGSDAVLRLKNARVAVFGCGGVGSPAAEALARAGVGNIDIIDPDVVEPSNINRQLVALHSTVGRLKAEVCKERLLDINPDINVNTFPVFYLPDNTGGIDLKRYDYIIDAVDTVAAKLHLAAEAERVGTPIISSMGTGNRLDPTAFKICDIYDTSGCPLAKTMRTNLRKMGVKSLKVVCSEELPKKSEDIGRTPASISFVPPVAGYIAASAVIRHLIGE